MIIIKSSVLCLSMIIIVLLMGQAFTRPVPVASVTLAGSSVRPSAVSSRSSSYAMPKHAAAYYTPKTHNRVSNWLDTSPDIAVPFYLANSRDYKQFQAQRMQVLNTMKHFNSKVGPKHVEGFLRPGSMHSYDPSRSGYSSVASSSSSGSSSSAAGRAAEKYAGLALVTGLAAAGVGAGVGIGVAVGNALSQNSAPPPRSVTQTAPKI
ncbi:hypothetical protein MP638_006022 [Amoeboaphelidium occidentale]|nr:hypothetical protein MP638_006022 [Amoeboaphelidium occidentale]